MKKRIISSIIALAMVVGMLPMTVLAEESTADDNTEATTVMSITETLTLADSTSDYSTDTYTWVKDTGTLTIDQDTTITVDGGDGIVFTGSSAKNIVLNADLTIVVTGSEGDGIYNNGSGSITISGSGNLSVNSSDRYGIYAAEGLTLQNSGKVNIASTDYYAIYIKNGMSITGSGDVNITSQATSSASGYGIYAYSGDVTINTGANITISAVTGILATEKISINIDEGGSLTSDKIQIAGNSSYSGTVTISGEGKVATTVDLTSGTKTVDLTGLSSLDDLTFSSSSTSADVKFADDVSTDVIEDFNISTSGDVYLGDMVYDSELGTYFPALDLTEAEKDISNDYYTWTAETKTLEILQDMAVVADGNSEDGIIFPSGAKLILSADLTVVANYYGIYVKDSSDGPVIAAESEEEYDLTISGTGNLNITADYGGICVGYGSLEIGSEETAYSGDITINAVYDTCLYAYYDITMNISGDVELTSTNDYGIAVSDGDLTITGNDTATLTVNSDSDCMEVCYDDDTKGNIYISKMYLVDLTSTDGWGIYANNMVNLSDIDTLYVDSYSQSIRSSDASINISDISEMTITSAESEAISAYVDVSIKNVYELTINADDYGIYAENDIIIENSTVIDNSDDGICSDNNITISGTSNVTTCYIDLYGTFKLQDTSIVNITDHCILVYVDLENGYEYIIIGEDATLNGTIYYIDANDYWHGTVYGEVDVENTAIHAYYKLEYGEYIYFAEDSVLTIYEGVTVDFNSYGTVIDWANANIENNGTIILTTGTTYESVAFENITGDGIIEIDGAYYDSDGETTVIPYEGSLVLSLYDDEDGTSYGFTWDSTNLILNLTDDLTINTVNYENSLKLTDGATINLNGYTLTVNNSNTACPILSSDDLTINGEGTIEINAPDNSANGIYSTGSIEIVNATIIDTSDYGITSEGDDITITSSYVETSCIDAYNDLSIEYSEITAEKIYAGYILDIEDSKVVADNIETFGTAALTISGESEVDAYQIYASYGDIIIKDTAIVTVSTYICTDNNAYGDYTVIVAKTASVTGLVSIYTLGNGNYDDTVYGDFVIYDQDQAWDTFWNGTLSFAEGSSLTINADISVGLSDYTIDWTNADITNDGYIAVYGEQYTSEFIAELGIDGDGYVVVLSDETEEEGTVYKNDGTSISFIEDISLDSSSESTDIYTWEEEDGTYTLTFLDETLVGGMYIDVEDAVINIANEITVMKMICATGSLTITGDGTLTVPEIANDDLYEAADDFYSEYVLTLEAEVTTDITWVGDVVINGVVVTNYIMACNLTVNNGATLTIADAILLTNPGTEPTLTFGTKIDLLSPSNGGFVTLYNSAEDVYSGTITTDGKNLSMDLSNWADNIKIGYKSSGSTTTTTPSSGSTTTEVEEETTATFEDVDTEAYYNDAIEWAVENEITNGISDDEFGVGEDGTREQVVTFLWRLAGMPTSDTENTFEDVSNDYYYDAVAWAIDNGITKGMTDDVFGTGEACTRAQIVTFLWRYAGEPEVESETSFDDVGADAYYAMAVAWAVENGITNGYGDDTFAPEDNCTREQIVTFLYRFASIAE